MNDNDTVEINYYWGDDTGHSSVRDVAYTGNMPAMVAEHKPKHASVAYAIAYLNGDYHSTIEVL